MQKKIVLNFSVDTIEEFDQIADSRFSKVLIRCFSDGANAHTEDVDFDDLKASADTVYDIPIKTQFTNQNPDGIGTHSPNYFNVGFVPRENNPINFVKDEKTGKTFLTVYGKIWTGDSRNIIDILKQTDGKKKVSVEMLVTDYKEAEDGKLKIKKFIYTAICILSDSISEACKGADVQLQFSKDKDEYYKLYYALSKIEIDNSKESAIGWNGSWTNPGRKLYSPIMNQPNAKTLLNEAYLVVEPNWETTPSSSLKYPHHKIVNGKLVVSAIGVISAYKRAAQQNILRGDVLAHIKKHNKELGLNLSFDFTDEKEVDNLEKDNEEKETIIPKENVAPESDREQEHEHEHENEQEHEHENEQEHEHDCEPEQEHEHEGDPEHEHEHEKSPLSPDIPEEKDEDGHPSEGLLPPTEIEIKYNNLCTEYNELKSLYESKVNECNTYMGQIKNMSDYGELKKFKEDTLAQRERERIDNEIKKTFAEIENKGISLSPQNKKTFTEKIKDFENLGAWANYIKAVAFDSITKSDDLITSNNIIDIPTLHNKPVSHGLWD